jgi:hypothetical protein
MIMVPTYQSGLVWFDADYLLWWTKSAHIPALVAPAIGGDAGALGPSEAQTLFAGGDADSGARSGGRFTLGFWLQDTHVLGLEGRYFFLAQHARTLASGAEDGTDLPQPLMLPQGVPPPGPPDDSYFIYLSSFLQSAEFNVVGNVLKAGEFRLDLLGGFRFLELNEKLNITQDFNSSDGSEEDTWEDEFRTRNNFYGGQIGARLEFLRDRFFVDMTTKVALGATNQRVNIDGSLTQAFFSEGTDRFGNPTQNVQVNRYAGGLLATPAAYRRDRFTVIPEVGINIGYQFNNFIRASLGYNFLYWSSVVRPGDQVTGVPRATDFWAQGLNGSLGLAF